MESQVNYLLDTNVWIERLLEQERSDDVKLLLETIPSERVSISDFSLHSIGVILTRLERNEICLSFINDLFVEGSVACLSLDAIENDKVIKLVDDKLLDFDDSYQWIVAEKFGLQLVTFDKDFGKNGFKTLKPKEAITIFHHAGKTSH